MQALPVTSPDGAGTVVHVYGTAGPSVLFLPGLGVPITYYEPFLEEWASRGFVIHALEPRGMPLSSTTDVRTYDFGYAHLLDMDIPAAIGQTALATPFVIAGHSLGGQLAMLYAGRRRGDVEAVVAIASGSSHPAALPTLRARMLRRIQVVTISSTTWLFGYWPGHRMGFGGRQPRTMINDWAREARSGRYRLAGSNHDDEGGLARVQEPVLMITLDGDRLIPRTAAAMLGMRATSTAVTTAHLTLDEQIDHFQWARRQPHEVAATITEWLSMALSPRAIFGQPPTDAAATGEDPETG